MTLWGVEVPVTLSIAGFQALIRIAPKIPSTEQLFQTKVLRNPILFPKTTLWGPSWWQSCSWHLYLFWFHFTVVAITNNLRKSKYFYFWIAMNSRFQPVHEEKSGQEVRQCIYSWWWRENKRSHVSCLLFHVPLVPILHSSFIESRAQSRKWYLSCPSEYVQITQESREFPHRHAQRATWSTQFLTKTPPWLF